MTHTQLVEVDVDMGESSLLARNIQGAMAISVWTQWVSKEEAS